MGESFVIMSLMREKQEGQDDSKRCNNETRDWSDVEKWSKAKRIEVISENERQKMHFP